MSLRETKKQRQREVLERVALQLFTERGYERTTVQDICERAEVAHATFYRYFPTKGHVLFAYRSRNLDALGRILRESPTDSDADWRGVVIAFADVLAADELLATRDWLAYSSPRLFEQALGVQREWEDTLARGLARRRGLDHTDLKAQLDAGAAMVVLRAALREWSADPNGPSFPARVDHAIAYWRNELGADGRHQEAR